METRIILGMGTGQCGLRGLVDVLNRQPGCSMTYQQAPFLTWNRTSADGVQRRFERMLSKPSTPIIGDAASFYLPYAREILDNVPQVRFVCLKRPCDEVIQKFRAFLKRNHPIPINHWTSQPGRLWHHDPYWTRIYPQFLPTDLNECLRRYWEEYDLAVMNLVHKEPDRVRLFDPELAFDTETGLRELLTFVGIPADQQVMSLGRWRSSPTADQDPKRERPLAPQASSDPMAPKRCVILVPFHSQIVPSCDEALRELDRRGYPIRRVGGYAAIDQGRNQMATDALMDGFEETFWIDADVGFNPDAIGLTAVNRQAPLLVVWTTTVADTG